MRLFEHAAFGVGKRFTPTIQTESAECGLACLVMVADYHGYSTDLASLRRRFSVSMKGMRLSSLADIADQLHLATRAVRVDLENLDQLRLPCILHWNLRHFVVLKSVSAKAITLADPARGLRTISVTEASKSFTGVALELWPNPGFQPRQEKHSVKLRDLTGHVSGLFRSLGQVLVLALTLELFAIASPFFMQWVIDDVLLSNDRDLLSTLALGFALLMVLQHSITCVRSWALIHMGTNLNVQWRANIFTHMLRLPGQYFERRHIGDIVSRFGSIDVFQRTLTTSFVEGILDGLMAIATLSMMFIYNTTLAWACVGTMTLYALSRWAWYHPLRMATAEQIAHAARQQSHFLETVRGVKTIKLFQRHEERRASWLTLLVDQMNADVRTQKLQVCCQLLNGLLFGCQNIIVVWFGARLVMEGGLSVGMLTAFISYRGLFATRVGSLIDKLVQLRMLQLHGERLADIVMTEPEAQPSTKRLVVSKEGSLEPSVELREVKFRYASHEPYVLNGVSIRIAAGESVAITGPSGCGKTTLMNIMLGVLAPTAGEVLIGNTSVQTLGVDEVRKMIAAVTQDDILFEGTITDNICFFDAVVDQEWVEECARYAAIHEDIAAMPMGYNTYVGHMGSALSGGQKQRVLLARALYRQPKILFLDEATSHLDIRCEQAVNASIRELQITRIVIAHRPQTIAMNDRLIRLKSGAVAEIRTISASERRRQRPAFEPGRQQLGGAGQST